jgi:hypothetical protein
VLICAVGINNNRKKCCPHKFSPGRCTADKISPRDIVSLDAIYKAAACAQYKKIANNFMTHVKITTIKSVFSPYTDAAIKNGMYARPGQ